MKREAELQKGVSAKDLQLAEEITIGAMPFKIRFNSLGWFPLWIRDNYHLLEPFYELLHNRQFLFEAFLEGEVTERFGDPQLERLRVNHGMIAEDRGLKEHPEANIPQLKKFFSSHNLLPITSAELQKVVRYGEGGFEGKQHAAKLLQQYNRSLLS